MTFLVCSSAVIYGACLQAQLKCFAMCIGLTQTATLTIFCMQMAGEAIQTTCNSVQSFKVRRSCLKACTWKLNTPNIQHIALQATKHAETYRGGLGIRFVGLRGLSVHMAKLQANQQCTHAQVFTAFAFASTCCSSTRQRQSCPGA